MRIKISTISAIALTVVLMASCVTKEKYNEAQNLASRYYDDAQDCNTKLDAAKVKISELTDELSRLKASAEKMAADTVKLSRELKRVQDDCAEMQQQNMSLLDKLQTSKSQEEFQALLAEIQKLQNELMQREDSLFKAERELSDKEAKIAELNSMIQEKERKMQEIKESIKNALAGYEGEGIQVTTKNGRIYVSLDEQLLFQSGKWNVNSNGETALTKLAGVLAEQKELYITVEGHTDNIPYNGSGNILDNWDLSVKRATAVVRILLKNPDVDPSRITAAGRSQFCPTDAENTAEARQKNRRTEIILSPNLDEVMKIINN